MLVMGWTKCQKKISILTHFENELLLLPLLSEQKAHKKLFLKLIRRDMNYYSRLLPPFVKPFILHLLKLSIKIFL